MATNLRSLSLSIHTATAKLLDSHAFGYLGRNLKVKTVYDSILSFDMIILARSQFQRDQQCIYYRPDELQLQRMIIGSCRLDPRFTIKLLRRMRSLDVVEVELLDCASSSCDSSRHWIRPKNSSRRFHNIHMGIYTKHKLH